MKQKPIFDLTVYEDGVSITNPDNNHDAFSLKINFPILGIYAIKYIDIYGVSHSWIDRKGLNYFECCGILKLFAITPPSFDELCQELKINKKLLTKK